MSSEYTWKGTVAATAIVSVYPDTSGNFWGDGVADDVEIQAAIDYVNALGGGSVALMTGTFWVNVTIYLRGKVGLVGQGVSATQLRAIVGLEANILEWSPIVNEYFAYVANMDIHGDASGTVGHGIYTTDNDGGEANDFWADHVWVWYCAQDGWNFEYNWGYKITNCLSEYNEGYGMVFSGTGHQNTVTNTFIAYSEGLYGLFLNSYDTVIHGCTIFGNMQHGIYVQRSDNILDSNKIIGNSASAANTYHGIYIDSSAHSTIVSNNNIEGGALQNNGIEALSDGNIIQGNQIFGNVNGVRLFTAEDNIIVGNRMGSNSGHDIRIHNASALNNAIGRNKLQSANKILDVGTGTQFETIPLYIASYNVTDVSESEDGLVVDEAGEWVSFVGQLPLHVQQVVMFEIWAVGLAAPGAGNQMCLTIEIEGGADDEPKTQHDTGALAGQLNTTENTAVNDIIHWVCTNANALALLGGDSVKCACRYNAAVDSDIATNAAFRRVLAHIV